MALKKCKECGHEISKSAKACPSCGAQIKKTGCLTKIVLGVIIFIAIGVIANLGSDKTGSVSNSGSGKADIKTTAPQIQIPEIEQDFIQVVEKFYEPYKQAPNDLKKSALRAERKDAIEAVLQHLEVTDWIGTLKQMGTNSDGKAYITIQLASSRFGVKTWNNAVSDIGANTLIESGTSLYEEISNLSKGDLVRFRGTFKTGDNDHIKEASMTERGSMIDPEFIMVFSSVSKY